MSIKKSARGGAVAETPAKKIRKTPVRKAPRDEIIMVDPVRMLTCRITVGVELFLWAIIFIGGVFRAQVPFALATHTSLYGNVAYNFGFTGVRENAIIMNKRQKERWVHYADSSYRLEKAVLECKTQVGGCPLWTRRSWSARRRGDPPIVAKGEGF